MATASAELAAALIDLIEANYTYDEVEEKRWIADADACEICQDNEDMGWIGDDEVFYGVFGPIDGPEAHPHCQCEMEYRTRRVRVYH